MAYQHVRDHLVSSPSKDSVNDPSAVLMARLTGADLMKPCQLVASNLWAKANRSLIDKEYDAKYKFNKPSSSHRLKMQALIMKELYSKLPDEEKQGWVDAAKKEHEDTMEKWNNVLHGPMSIDPANHQWCVSPLFYLLFCSLMAGCCLCLQMHQGPHFVCPAHSQYYLRVYRNESVFVHWRSRTGGWGPYQHHQVSLIS